MITDIDENILKIIKNAVVTVPGVASFADYHNTTTPSVGNDNLATLDIDKSIELLTAEISRFKIHVILISGINIKDVINEIQIRVKYELEKSNKFTNKYLVDVIVEGITNN
ncbi:hypothetical protein [Mesoplasma whartonense]|uniref:hypothetical protein n=1 Tax=Mesoplasma whartonense TaxID=2878854 RepID=UPI002022B2E4|nr:MULTISPECIES: hypothetical protein [unclassified Mesoplasma]MCL8212997.1 hypothetical protein [Mesoplasma sp. JKS002661]MCL8213582.1 hypothetical protein [Mesoplasma sp. JKS002660]MCL8216258.1 hypothetical protein [Mesoplasma sp. JKS002657]